jgi:ribosomal protein L24
VFSRDSLRGSVYVEAHAHAHVQRLLNGIKGTYRSPQKLPHIDLIPLEERIMLLEMDSLPITITTGTWVRMKCVGHYRGDLALVQDVAERFGTADVLLVPRIPLDRKRDRKRRAKLALFDADMVKEYYGTNAMTRRNRYWSFQDKFYRDGLLLQEFALHKLSDRFVNPAQDELALFRQTHNEWVVKAVDSVTVPLHINDGVQVVEGPLRGFSGYLTDIRGDRTATLESNTLQSPLQVLTCQVRKKFCLGDFVQAVCGEHRGEEGFIVEMDEVSTTIYRHNVVKCADVSNQQAGDEVGFHLFNIVYDNHVFFA